MSATVNLTARAAITTAAITRQVAATIHEILDMPPLRVAGLAIGALAGATVLAFASTRRVNVAAATTIKAFAAVLFSFIVSALRSVPTPPVGVLLATSRAVIAALHNTCVMTGAAVASMWSEFSTAFGAALAGIVAMSRL